MKKDDLEFMLECFPNKYKLDIAQIVRVLKFDRLNYHSNTDEVILSYGRMTLPTRIYYFDLTDKQIGKLSDIQKRLLYCYFLTHHDGYVRQKYLRKLLSSNYLLEHEIPYVFSLIGSYVIEIIEDIYEKFDLLIEYGLEEFICLNHKLTITIEGRLASYWGEYYRGYSKKDYIGFKIQKFLKNTRKKCSDI